MGFRFRKGGGERELPDEGNALAVCVDIVDLGLQVGKYGAKAKVQFIFAVEQVLQAGDYAGQNMLLFASFGNTTSTQGRLRPFLDSWAGEPLTDDELDALDTDDLLGRPAEITIEHSESDGSTFANIAAIVPGPEEDADWMKAAVDGYVRPPKVDEKAKEGQRRAQAEEKAAAKPKTSKPSGGGFKRRR